MIILVLLKYQFVQLEVDYCHLKLQLEAGLTGLLGTSYLVLSSVVQIHPLNALVLNNMKSFSFGIKMCF